MNADPRPRAAPDHRGFLAHCYNRIEELLGLTRRWLRESRFSGPTFREEVLRRRLVQEANLLLDEPVRRRESHRAYRGESSELEDCATLTAGGLVLDARTGQLKPTPKLFIVSTGKFLGLCLASLGLGLVALLGIRRVSGGTVVFGVPDEGLFRGDDAAFADFARRGPIEPLNQARTLFIQSVRPGAASTDPRICYARHPLLELLRRAPTGTGDAIRLVALHVATALQYLAAVVRRPLLILLWRDYGFLPAAASLDRRGLLDAVVLTNSNLGRQLLSLSDLPGQRFRLHFIFYSEHDRPAVYVDVPERCPVSPTIPQLRIHHAWVWTEGRARMLHEHGVDAQVHVVGPIVWEVLDQESLQRDGAWISVFDITPLTDDAAIEFGYLGDYYSASNMVKFIDGIEAAVRAADINLPIVLKPKRNTVASKSNARYLARLNGDSAIQQLPPSSSVYSVVAKSAVVIVYPFTTVAYVAEHLGVPAIYFDPTGRREALFEPGRHIRYASGVAQLADALRQAVGPHA